MKIKQGHLRTIIQEELRRVVAEATDEDYIRWAESEDVSASIDAYYKACREAGERLADDLGTSIGAQEKWVLRCLKAVQRSILESPDKTIF